MIKKIKEILTKDLGPIPGKRWIQKFNLRTTGFLPVSNKKHFFRDITQHSAHFCKQGLPLGEGLESLAKGEFSATASLQSGKCLMLYDMAKKVRSGVPLSAACDFYPGVFPVFYRKMLRLGESTGALGEVLDSLNSYYRLRWERWRPIISALYYPLFLIIVSSLIVSMFIVFIIPKFVELYGYSETLLPQPIHFLNNLFIPGLSSVFLLVIMSLILIVSLRLLWFFETTRRIFYGGSRWIPGIGPLVAAGGFAMFCNGLGMLLRAGRPLPEAVKDVAGVIPDAWLSGKLFQLIPELEKGQSLPDLLQKHRLADPQLLWKWRMGEWGHQLPQALDRIVRLQNLKLQNSLQFLKIIESLSIIMVGIFL